MKRIDIAKGGYTLSRGMRYPNVFPGESVNDITIDGFAIVEVTPNGGSSGNVGLVSKVEAYANPLKRETTKGSPAVGWDLGIKFDMTQTRSAEWAAIVDARQADLVKVTGAMTICSLANVFLSVGAKIMFSNKSESAFECEAVHPGATPTQAKAFITNNS